MSRRLKPKQCLNIAVNTPYWGISGAVFEPIMAIAPNDTLRTCPTLGLLFPIYTQADESVHQPPCSDRRGSARLSPLSTSRSPQPPLSLAGGREALGAYHAKAKTLLSSLASSSQRGRDARICIPACFLSWLYELARRFGKGPAY